MLLKFIFISRWQRQSVLSRIILLVEILLSLHLETLFLSLLFCLWKLPHKHHLRFRRDCTYTYKKNKHQPCTNRADYNGLVNNSSSRESPNSVLLCTTKVADESGFPVNKTRKQRQWVKTAATTRLVVTRLLLTFFLSVKYVLTTGTSVTKLWFVGPEVNWDYSHLPHEQGTLSTLWAVNSLKCSCRELKFHVLHHQKKSCPWLVNSLGILHGNGSFWELITFLWLFNALHICKRPGAIPSLQVESYRIRRTV